MNLAHHSFTPDSIKRLGRAGVEVVRSAVDPASVIHRPRELAPELAACLAACKPQLIAILRDGYQPTPDAADIFTERLAVADGLEMPTHPGSPAWLVAVGEALAHDPSWAVLPDRFTKAAADAGVPPCGQALVAHALRLFPGSSVAHVQRLRPGQSAKEFL